MRHSIKKQFALIFILLMGGVIFLCWLTNTLFLERYYLSRKTKVIYSAYVAIKNAAEENSYDSEEFQEELEKVCRSSNISAFVMNSDSEMKYVSTNGGERLEMALYGYLLGYNSNNVQIIREEEEFRIQRSDKNAGGYLEMYGRLDSGISFLMRTPLDSIKESASMANRFFFYVGILGSAGGAVIIWLVTGKMAKPILTLNQISERMVKLDFDAKYEGRSNNEIDLLGENMNRLSQSLEEAISNLKSANNELRRDIERKDQKDEMRREFLANVSHELKTPIALIQGYAEGLQEGMGDSPEDREYYCGVIVDEAQKMNCLVQKLMTLNQLEFGNNTIDMERFDAIAMISNSVESGSLLAKQQGTRIVWEETEPCHVWADPFLTEEIIQNYLSNALHYCKNEKIIEITTKIIDKKLRIMVKNTGDPIPEEALPRIWEKFYKVDKARTREYGGSGVGLSIVKAIMDGMHQQYGVENQEDGVMFWFELELAEMEEGQNDRD